MKKWLVFIFALAAIYSCNNSKFNTYFTLSETSTNPYDIKFFYDEVKTNSPNEFKKKEFTWSQEIRQEELPRDEGVKYADDFTSGAVKEEAEETFLSVKANETYIAVCQLFVPKGNEITALKSYIAKGNIAFISSFYFGKDFQDSLLNASSKYVYGGFPPELKRDTIRVNWLNTEAKLRFVYPGHYTDIQDFKLPKASFDPSTENVSTIDTLIVDEKTKKPLLLRLQLGYGRLYLSNNPLMLSNYFLLHKSNYKLFNLIAQELDIVNRDILWDSYYKSEFSMNKDNENQKGDSVLNIIKKYPNLQWALYVTLIALCIYFAMYSRRMVKEIEIKHKTSNTSLDFVKTLAGVYWNRNDNASIAQKLFHQFYEYLHREHHVNSSEITTENIDRIASKIGKPREAIIAILNDITDYNNSKTIDTGQLKFYYQNLSTFYNS